MGEQSHDARQKETHRTVRRIGPVTVAETMTTISHEQEHEITDLPRPSHRVRWWLLVLLWVVPQMLLLLGDLVLEEVAGVDVPDVLRLLVGGGIAGWLTLYRFGPLGRRRERS